MSDLEANLQGTSRRRRGLILIAAAMIILLLGSAFLVLVDPFDWRLVDRLSGKYDAAAAVVPPGSVAYAGVNLLSSNVTRLDDLLNTISAATAGTSADVDSLRRQVDEMLSQELGLSLEEDLLPWLGQYIGFAVVDVELDAFGRLAGISWVLAAETRDRGASDRFLEDLSQAWGTSTGEAPSSESYHGITLTRFEGLAFGRSGGVLLLASSADALRQALDAQRGSSLVDMEAYEAAVNELPAERSVTLYFGGEQLNRLIASIPTPLPRISPENLPTASMQGTAISLALVDSGIQVDTATLYDPEKMSSLQRRALETGVSDPRTSDLFPAETLVFLSGQGIDLFWAGIRRALIAEIGRADFDESMRLFVREFGIDPDEALLPYLDGEAAAGFWRNDQGTMASMLDVGMDAAIVVGTSDESSLASNVAAFSERIGRPQGGLGSVSTVEMSDLSLYRFETALVPDFLITYGVGHGYLLVGTSDGAIQSLQFDGEGSLADRDDFIRLSATLPEDLSPGLFVDVHAVFDVIRAGGLMDAAASEAMAAAIRPFPYLVGGGSGEGNVARSTLIVFVTSGE